MVPDSKPVLTVADLPAAELSFQPIRASGPGGQHVNKVATAVQLRFDVRASSLPEPVKSRLLRLSDHRFSKRGIITIKAQGFRSQAKNRQDALARLDDLLALAQRVRKRRKPTSPSLAVMQKRLESKRRQGERKRLRGPVTY